MAHPPVGFYAWCCGAPSKEACVHPPCPCNIDGYSKRELRELEDRRRADRRKAGVDTTPPNYDPGL